MINRIHIVGAAGSGTTTLAQNLSEELKYKHFDTDDFFWVKTDPPFLHKTEVNERIKNLKLCLNEEKKWVLSGSLCGWGDVFIPYFDMVVFLHIPKEVRMQRLLARERKRYGEKIEKNKEIYEHHLAFMEWASKYDEGGLDIRSKKLHYEWLDKLECEVLKIEEDVEVEEKIKRIKKVIDKETIN